jgi:hypothetical protein
MAQEQLLQSPPQTSEGMAVKQPRTEGQEIASWIKKSKDEGVTDDDIWSKISSTPIIQKALKGGATREGILLNEEGFAQAAASETPAGSEDLTQQAPSLDPSSPSMESGQDTFKRLLDVPAQDRAREAVRRASGPPATEIEAVTQATELPAFTNPPTDDAAPEFINDATTARLNQARARRKEQLQRFRGQDAAPAGPEQEGQPYQGEYAEFRDAIESDDSIYAAVAKDVGYGIIEAPGQIVGGVYEAGRNVLTAIDDLAWWLNDNVADLTIGDSRARAKEGDRENIFTMAPEFALDPTTTTGAGIRSVTQFVTGFIPAVRAARTINVTTRLGRVAQIEGAGAVAAALVFDPHEERLANLIQSVPAIQNPITEYLAADPDDTAMEGRFKNAIEGLGFGVLAEGVVLGVRAIKLNRVAAGGVQPEDVLGKVQRREPDPVLPKIVANLGDANLPGIREKAGKKSSEFMGELASGIREGAERAVGFRKFIANGDSTELPFEMNWAKFSSSEEVEEVLKNVANKFRGSFDEARRGKITDTNLKELSESLNMTPDDLLARRPGEAYNAEQILAARAILDASANKVIELGRAARLSTDAADLYSFQKMMDIHAGLQKQFTGLTAEAGRALRAFQLQPGSTARQLRDIEEVLNMKGGAGHLRSMAEAVSRITNKANLSRAVVNSLGRRSSDALQEAWYFALLSGPQTHAVNIVSSAANTLWLIPERWLASQFAALRGATDSVAAGEASELFYGMIGGFNDAIGAAARAFRSGENIDLYQKVEMRTHEAITAEKFPLGSSLQRGADWLASNTAKTIAGKRNVDSGMSGRAVKAFVDTAINGVGRVARLPTRFLMAEDTFSQVMAKGMQIRAEAFRMAKSEGLEGTAFARRVEELRSNPTQAMMDSAQGFGREINFTTQLGESGQSFQRGINRMPIFKVAMPFVRTPVNLGKWAGKRSPLAPLAGSVRRDILGGGVKADMALARLTMGSMFMFSIVDLSMRGLVTGNGPIDPELRAVWLQTNQPYSFNHKGQFYSYNRLDPFGILLGTSADLGNIIGEINNIDADEIVMAGALAASRSVFSKTWMTGPSNILEALNDPERYGKRYFQRTAGTFLVPTGSAQVARYVDPVWREVNSFGDEIKSRVPGWSKTLPARRNIWGEVIMSQGGVGPDMISPIYKYQSEDRPIDVYLLENKIPLQMPGRIINGVELTPQEYSRYVELAGNALPVPDYSPELGTYDTLNALIDGSHEDSSEFLSLTDGPEGGKAAYIRSIIQNMRDVAKFQLGQESPDLNQRILDIQVEDYENLTGETVDEELRTVPN